MENLKPNIHLDKIKFNWDEGFAENIEALTDPISNAQTIKYVRSYLDSQIPSFSSRNGNRITYIDLFCGGGGLSLGVHHALHKFGFDAKLLLAADTDKKALRLIKHHFKPMIHSDLPIEDWLRYSVDLSGIEGSFVTHPEICNPQINQFKGKVDLLVGGPPCQGHSNLNNKTRRYDPRNLLYFTMPAMAICMDIPLVIIENVRSIKSASENVVGITKKLFRAHDYFVNEVILDGVHCGIAQTRKRHFLIASKFEEPNVDAAIDQLRTPTLTFNDVNSDLPILEQTTGLLEGNPKLSNENIDRINHLHNTNQLDLKNELRPICHQEGHTYPAVYGRIDGNKPAGTITTGFSSPGRGRFIHPNEPRMITVREAARVQSFPDWYFLPAEQLGLNRINLTKIIGDAVPALMLFPLIASVANSLSNK